MLVFKMGKCKVQTHFSWNFLGLTWICTCHGTNAGRTTSTSLSSPLWGLTRNSYKHTEQLFHWETLTQSNFTHRSVYTEEPLQPDFFTLSRAFTQRNCCTPNRLHAKNAHAIFCMKTLSYTQTPLQNKVFTHRRFYTQKPLHTDAFTHRRPYTKMLLHTEPCTQSLSHTHTFSTQRQGCDWRFKIRFFRPFFCMCWPSFRAKKLQQTLWNRISPQLLHPRQLRHRHF